jgi:hypothetical protein
MKGVGKSRKEMVELLSTGQKKGPGKELESGKEMVELLITGKKKSP